MTTDIAVHRPGQHLDVPAQDAAIAKLAEWAHALDAAYTMAQKLVQTSFVPQHYRNKPAEAAAAILTGIELGFGPMAALRAFDNIQGTPAPKAITLRAVVQSCGHEVNVLEESPTRAVVTGRRKGEREWQSSTWTIERAQTAGYVTKNPNYKSNPQAMLVARATAQVCRWIASDAIMGMPYSAEELQDHPEMAGPPATKRVTAADILAQPPQLEQPQPDAWDGVEVATPPDGGEGGS